MIQNSSSRYFIVPVGVGGWQAGYGTATQEQTEEFCAFGSGVSIPRSGNSNYWRHPCAFYRTPCTQNTTVLGVNLPFFFLFIPLWITNPPPLLSTLQNKFNYCHSPGWLDSRSFLNSLQPCTYFTALQTKDLAQFSQQARLSPWGSVCNKIVQDTQLMPWCLQIKRCRLLRAPRDKWPCGQCQLGPAALPPCWPWHCHHAAHSTGR